jgi:hypothetical protein
MLLKTPQILAIAATLTLLPIALVAQADPTQASDTTAAQMVPARVELLSTIDAKKSQTGAEFKARLTDKVHLGNGAELPAGTILIGTVAADDMNVQGNSKLALRFTSAQLKNGTTMPIKATIFSVETAANQSSASADEDVMSLPLSWKSGTPAVDQIGVAKGVDLHSKLSSQNSGVFVSTRQDNVKLGKGSDLSLALAAGQGSQQDSSAAATGHTGS